MYSGGSGTSGDPYLIATPQDLYDVRSNLSAYFLQTKDIDLDVSPYNTGNGWIPIGTLTSEFIGSYDGGGYKILNLYIKDRTINHQGLFGYCEGAVFKKIGLENVDISSAFSDLQIGCLAGFIRDTTIVSECYATGVIDMYDCDQIGGLVGAMGSNGDRISDCWTNVTITGDVNLGGICANDGGSDGIISECHADGDITGINQVGGIAYNADTRNCAANMDTLTRSSGTGTLFVRVGFAPNTNNYANSAMTLPVTPTSDVNGQDGLDKTLTELKTKSTYETDLSWDFDDIWYIRQGKKFPELRAFRALASALFFGTNF